MTDYVEFVVFGPPVPFARAGGGSTRRRFTPPKQRDYMLQVRAVAYAKMLELSATPLEGPLRLTVDCVFEYPASWPKKKVAETHWHTAKPDYDNLAKLVGDCIGKNESLASHDRLPLAIVFGDDAQIADGRATKRYGGPARLVVRVERLS